MQHVLGPKQPQPGGGRVYPGLRVPLSSGDDEDNHQDDEYDEDDHEDGDYDAYSSKPSATSSIATENICRKYVVNTMPRLSFGTAI